MKTETYQSKLAKMLGLEEHAPKIEEKKKSSARNDGAFTRIEFAEVEKYRESAALALFLEAPALFSIVTCRQCKEPFAVSRRFVSFCSYGCLAENLRGIGIEWHPSENVDTAYVLRVWDGNEPMRVTPGALRIIKEMIENAETDNSVDAGTN